MQDGDPPSNDSGPSDTQNMADGQADNATNDPPDNTDLVRFTVQHHQSHLYVTNPYCCGMQAQEQDMIITANNPVYRNALYECRKGIPKICWYEF